MPTESLQAWAEEKIATILPIAEKRVFEDGIPPLLFLYGPEGKALVLPGNVLSKDGIMAVMKNAQKVPGMQGTILLDEMWVVEDQGAKGDPQALQKFKEKYSGSISQHPDRYEAVGFNCIRGDEQVLFFYRMNRETKKLEGPPVIMNNKTHLVEGRMIVNPEKPQ